MKKLILLALIVAAAVGAWYFLRPTNQMTNKNVTYVVDIEGTKPTTRDGAQALSYTRGKTVIITAGPDSSISEAGCPSVAPIRDRDITIESVNVPLCVTANGGIAMAPFVHNGRWHLITMFSTGDADMDLAAELFQAVSVKKQ